LSWQTGLFIANWLIGEWLIKLADKVIYRGSPAQTGNSKRLIASMGLIF
jgi:hypothetical protein